MNGNISDSPGSHTFPALSQNMKIDLNNGNSKTACNIQDIAVLPEPKSGKIVQQIKKPDLPLLVIVAPLDSERGWV